MSKSINVLAFGEILWDLLPEGPVLGGAPFNLACRLHLLGHQVHMASRLGRDELGRRARERMRALGLDEALIQWDDVKPTGTVPIRLDASGTPDFTIVPDVAYDYLEASDALLAAATRADCCCFGTLIQRHSVARNTLQAVLEAATDALKVLDINLRRDCYTAATVRDSLPRADLLKLNEDEVGYVADLLRLPASPLPEFADRVVETVDLKLCVITLGAKGVFAANAEGERAYEPGRKVAVRDTCGAGDGLTAAFLDAFFAGAPLAECCRRGNAMGALVATQAGATEPVRRTDLDAFLADLPEPIIEPALHDFLSAEER
jgi:fructokinase